VSFSAKSCAVTSPLNLRYPYRHYEVLHTGNDFFTSFREGLSGICAALVSLDVCVFFERGL
jgi:hypothetical protein